MGATHCAERCHTHPARLAPGMVGPAFALVGALVAIVSAVRILPIRQLRV
jgi:hypothetical protein